MFIQGVLNSYEDNFNHEFAEFISGFSDEDDFKLNDYMVLFMETMVDTTKESSQNPQYGEPVEFVFPLIVVDNQLEVKDEEKTAEALGVKLMNADLEYWAREKDPENLKMRAETVLDEAISGKYDGSVAVLDNMAAYGCYFYYVDNLLYTPEEAKQEFMADGDSADLAEEEAALLCTAQKMSTYKCMDVTKKDGDYVVPVSVTVADLSTFLNNISEEIAASITEEDFMRFSGEEEFYEYYKENFAVQIIDGTGTLVQIFDLNIEGKVRKAAATPIGRRTDEQKALISLYGRALSSMDPTKNPNLFEAPWIGNTSKDTKTRIDLFVNGECGYINGTKVDYTANNLKRFQNSGAKFIEQYTEYAYKGDTISSEDGTETITGNTKPETKIVITYSVIF